MSGSTGRSHPGTHHLKCRAQLERRLCKGSKTTKIGVCKERSTWLSFKTSWYTLLTFCFVHPLGHSTLCKAWPSGTAMPWKSRPLFLESPAAGSAGGVAAPLGWTSGAAGGGGVGI